MASWAEIKAVLDDPNVSMGTKTRLMENYDKNTFNFNDEEEKYASKYVEGYDDGGGGYDVFASDDTDEIVKDAKTESDAVAKSDKAEEDKKNKAHSDLDAIQPPASGGVGAKTSDELLDLGNVTVDFLCTWAENMWNKRPDGSGNIDPQKDLKDKFHENRGINFQKFLDDADALTKAHQVVDTALTDSDTELGTLFGEWKGSGAKAAQIKYDESIKPDAKELQDQISGAATLIPQTVTAVYTSVKRKVDEVINLHRTTVAHAELDTAKKVLRIARKETESFDDYMEIASWIDSVCPGSNLCSRLQNDDCAFNDENKEYGRNLCLQWVNGSFTDEFTQLLNAFNGSCKTANDTIDQQFGALATFMDDYTNGFTDAQVAPSHDGGGGDSAGGGGGTGGGGTGGGGTGGGGPAGGGSTTPSATPPAVADQTAGHKPADGMNPVTGKPLENDPSTGQAYPINPQTGAAIKNVGADQDTVSVEKGDNKIKMSEPDKDGKMAISVDDGSGHHKDYKLDFGNDKTDGKDGVGKPDEFGPQGTKDVTGTDGKAGDGAYKPGPDGKIHVQDGDLKITAERPQGPNGPTVVTVDDGKGEPTKYTLDENDHGKTGLKPGDPQSVDPTMTSATDAGAHGSAQPTAGPAGATGFSAPGGLNLDGDLGTVGTSEGAPGDSSGGVGADSATAGLTAPATAAEDFFSGGVPGEATGAVGGLGEALNLENAGHEGSEPLPAAADAGLGVAPGGGAPNGPHQDGAGAGGMSPLGGMMGGAGGSGGDQQRGSSQYRIEGGLFETSGAGGRISGSLDDEEEQPTW